MSTTAVRHVTSPQRRRKRGRSWQTQSQRRRRWRQTLSGWRGMKRRTLDRRMSGGPCMSGAWKQPSPSIQAHAHTRTYARSDRREYQHTHCVPCMCRYKYTICPFKNAKQDHTNLGYATRPLACPAVKHNTVSGLVCCSGLGMALRTATTR